MVIQIIAMVFIFKCLKNLKPEIIRYLYNSIIILVTDYALVIKTPNICNSVLKQLKKV